MSSFPKDHEQLKLAIIGVGYVGIHLALAFGKNRPVIAFDSDKSRVSEIRRGYDRTKQVESSDLESCWGLRITYDEADLAEANCFIICVPTPVNSENKPDLSLLMDAATLVSKHIKKGSLVIFESTVFPGCTDDWCIPKIEEKSGLTCNIDFACGYSPERINPGDKDHGLENTVKITSASNPEAATLVDELYKTISPAGTHRAKTIKIAESAKVIENVQRDVNIALVNEFSIIFNLMDLDTLQILEAAETKWNFARYRPGLVGGHCISVDPYYLTFASERLGYSPKIVLSGRHINNQMSSNIASRLAKGLLQKELSLQHSRVLILGFSYKEDCPDIRNTKVDDLVRELLEFKLSVDIFDPLVDPEEVYTSYQRTLLDKPNWQGYDACIIAVAHAAFVPYLETEITRMKKDGALIFDLKGALPQALSDLRP